MAIRLPPQLSKLRTACPLDALNRALARHLVLNPALIAPGALDDAEQGTHAPGRP